jgi:hypothetical protein
MKALSILCLFAASFLIFSCKKKVDELPPATQTGAHTFGAKVNGEMWVPQSFGMFPASNLLEARFVGNTLRIQARNFASSPTETEFEIFLLNATAPGTFQLNTDGSYRNPAANYGYYVKRNVTPINEWQTSSQYTGTVTLTRVDTAAKIVSGTFQFNAINQYNTPVPLSVTEGRFDIKSN